MAVATPQVKAAAAPRLPLPNERMTVECGGDVGVANALDERILHEFRDEQGVSGRAGDQESGRGVFQSS